jgi:hypothetical protein
MYRKFLSARSPLRLLEQGLHGGLGKGNIGLVLAGPGVGKTSFLVGVALDDLLRGGHVLHVSLDQSVPHTRAYYDTVFHELAYSTHLEDEARVHADIDRLRSIRSYPAPGFGPGKLREAVKFEEEAGCKPGLVILEGFDVGAASRQEMHDLKALAAEIEAELWLSVACPGEAVPGIPESIAELEDAVSVILALEPEPDSVALRALKEHDNPDPEALRVALDPKTLLLVRS